VTSKQLTELLQANNLTQQQIADAIGINVRTIRRYVSDRHPPKYIGMAILFFLTLRDKQPERESK